MNMKSGARCGKGSPSLKPFLVTAVLALTALNSQAGSIVFTDTTTGSPSISTYSPLTPWGSGPGSCSPGGAYDRCGTVLFFLDAFDGSAKQLQIVDDTAWTSVTDSITAGSGTFYDDFFSDPNNPGYAGLEITAGFIDGNIIGVSFSSFQGYPSYQSGLSCASVTCVGPITGGVQDAFTVNYLGSTSGVLGSDAISFEGQGAGTPEGASTPEPDSVLTLLSGLALVGIGAIRRRA